MIEQEYNFMNKQDIYDYLKKHGVDYEITEHKAVYSMEELAEVNLPHDDALAKNIFVRDDKKSAYYIITSKHGKRINLKELRHDNGTRRLTFADEEDMARMLQLAPGSVSPLGLLNDSERSVSLFIDSEFMNEPAFIGIHPNDNTATIWLRTEELIRIIKEHGNEVRITDIK